MWWWKTPTRRRRSGSPWSRWPGRRALGPSQTGSRGRAGLGAAKRRPHGAGRGFLARGAAGDDGEAGAAWPGARVRRDDDGPVRRRVQIRCALRGERGAVDAEVFAAGQRDRELFHSLAIPPGLWTVL